MAAREVTVMLGLLELLLGRCCYTLYKEDVNGNCT